MVLVNHIFGTIEKRKQKKKTKKQIKNKRWRVHVITRAFKYQQRQLFTFTTRHLATDGETMLLPNQFKITKKKKKRNEDVKK